MTQFIEEVWDIINTDKRYKDWKSSRRGRKMIEKTKKEIRKRAELHYQFIRITDICWYSTYDDNKMIEKWAKENGFDVGDSFIFWTQK